MADSRWAALTGVILGLLAARAAAAAARLHVAANGVDTAGCGPATAPCRSITDRKTGTGLHRHRQPRRQRHPRGERDQATAVS
jgi:hypothetical protein